MIYKHNIYVVLVDDSEFNVEDFSTDLIITTSSMAVVDAIYSMTGTKASLRYLEFDSFTEAEEVFSGTDLWSGRTELR